MVQDVTLIDLAACTAAFALLAAAIAYASRLRMIRALYSQTPNVPLRKLTHSLVVPFLNGESDAASHDVKALANICHCERRIFVYLGIASVVSLTAFGVARGTLKSASSNAELASNDVVALQNRKPNLPELLAERRAVNVKVVGGGAIQPIVTETVIELRTRGYRVYTVRDDEGDAPDRAHFQVLSIGKDVPAASAAEILGIVHRRMPWIKYAFREERDTFAADMLLNADNVWVKKLGLRPIPNEDFDRLSSSTITETWFDEYLNRLRDGPRGPAAVSRD